MEAIPTMASSTSRTERTILTSLDNLIPESMLLCASPSTSATALTGANIPFVLFGVQSRMQAINPAAPRNVNPTQSTVIGAAHGAGRVTADTAGYDFDDDFFNVSFGLYRYWHQVLPPEESGACDFLRAASTVRIAFHDNTGFVRNRREMLDNLARHLARVPFPRNDVPRTLVLALPMPESMRLEMNIQGQENLAREISGYIFQEMMNASAAGMDTVDPCTLPDEIVFEWIVV